MAAIDRTWARVTVPRNESSAWRCAPGARDVDEPIETVIDRESAPPLPSAASTMTVNGPAVLGSVLNERAPVLESIEKRLASAPPMIEYESVTLLRSFALTVMT